MIDSYYYFYCVGLLFISIVELSIILLVRYRVNVLEDEVEELRELCEKQDKAIRSLIKKVRG